MVARALKTLAGAALLVALSYAALLALRLVAAGAADLSAEQAAGRTPLRLRRRRARGLGRCAGDARRAPARAAPAQPRAARRGLLPARQRRQPRRLVFQCRLLSPPEPRPVHARLPRLRQEQRAHRQPGATRSRCARGVGEHRAALCGQAARVHRPLARQRARRRPGCRSRNPNSPCSSAPTKAWPRWPPSTTAGCRRRCCAIRCAPTKRWRACKSPLLLVHGERDEIIGAQHSERLLRAAPHAERVLIAGAGHNDLQLFPAYLDALAARLR